MKIKTKELNVTFNPNIGKYACWFEVPAQQLEELNKISKSDKFKNVEIKLHREKRSLDSNSYAWQLMSQIAKKLTTTSEEIYTIMLDRYGVHKYYGALESDILELKKSFKFVEIQDEITLNGVKGYRCKCTLGSSKYDTLQMSQFINGVVADATELGIETMTPSEVENLMKNHGGMK